MFIKIFLFILFFSSAIKPQEKVLVTGAGTKSSQAQVNRPFKADSAEDLLSQISETSKKIIVTQAEINEFYQIVSEINLFRRNDLDSKDLAAFQEAINFARYSGVFEDEVLKTDANGWDLKDPNSLPSKLDVVISQVSAEGGFVQNYPDNFLGKRQKLKDILDAYKNLSPEKINSLIQANKLPSFLDVIGKSKEGFDGMIAELVFQRLDDEASELFSQSGSPVSGSENIDARRSWRGSQDSLRVLISEARSIFSDSAKFDGVNKQDLNDKRVLWDDYLDSSISFQDQVESLERISRNGWLDKDEAEFKNRVNRMILSIDDSATPELRRKALNSIEDYVVNNVFDRSDYEVFISALKRDVVASEIFSNGEVISLSWSGSEEEKLVSFQGSGTSASLLADNISSKTVQLKVLIKEEKAIFEYFDGTDKYYLRNDTGVFQLEENILSKPNVLKNYYFYVVGSRESLSLQSAQEDGGLLTVGLNESLKTVNDLTGAPLIRFSQDGSIEQNSRNTFSVFQITEISKALALKRDEKENVSAQGLLNLFESYRSALLIVLGGDLKDKALFCKEVSKLFEFLSKDQDLYQASKGAEEIKVLEEIVSQANLDFSKESSGSDDLRKALSDLNFKWDYFQEASILKFKEAPEGSPKASDLIAFRAANGKFLHAFKKEDALGGEVFYLKADLDSPASPAAHFVVSRVSSVFGFQSEYSNKGYLSVFDLENQEAFSDLERELSNRITFYSRALSKDEIEIPFEAKENILSHFIFEELTSQDGTFFVLKSVLNNQYLKISDQGLNDGFFVTDSNDSTKFEIIYVNKFFKALGITSIQEDDLVKLRGSGEVPGFLSLIEFLGSTDDFRFLISEVKSFLTKKRRDFKAWKNLLEDREKTDALDLIIKKLSDLSLEESSIFSSAAKDVVELERFYLSAFEANLEDYKDEKVAIRWVGFSDKSKYLSFKEAAPAFSSDSKINPEGSLELIFENENVAIKYLEKFLAYQNDSFVLSSDPSEKALFEVQGPINKLSFSLNNKFLTVKSDGTLSLSDGMKVGKVSEPFENKQTFALETISELEDLLIQARSIFDFEKLEASTGQILHQTDSEFDAQEALAQRVGLYSTFIAAISLQKDLSFDEKSLIFNEIESFVKSLTEDLSGLAYIELIGDESLNDLFENSVLLELLNLSENNKELKERIDKITLSWSEGYLGESSLKNNDLVAIKIRDKFEGKDLYLTAVETVFQGSKYLNLKATRNPYKKSSHFKVKTYKDKVSFVSASFSGRALTAQSLDGREKADRIKKRIALIPELKDSSGREIPFGTQGTESQQFVLEEKADDKSVFNIFSSLHSQEVERAYLVIDRTDENFLVPVFLAGDEFNLNSDFKIVFIEGLDKKLTEVNETKSNPEKLKIFHQILSERYVNLENADSFSEEFNNFLRNLKMDQKAWASFSRDKDQKEKMNEILSLIDEQVETLGSQNVDEIKAVYSGDFSAALDELDGKLITIGWKDARGENFYLQRVVENNLVSLKFSSQDGLDPASQFFLEVSSDQETNRGSVSLYYLLGEGEAAVKEYIFVQNNELFLTDPTNSNQVGDEFITLGPQEKISFKFFDQNNQELFLTVSPTDKSVFVQPGVGDLYESARPLPTLQMFMISPVSSLEELLGKIRKEQKPETAVDIYSSISYQFSQEGAQEEDKKLLFDEVERFILEGTSNLAKYKELAGNTDLNDRLIMLFSQLEELAGKGEEFLDQVEKIAKTWDEGYLGPLYASAPQDKDLVVIRHKKSGKFLEISEQIYMGKTYLNLSPVGSSITNSASHFRVSTYKNRYNFESEWKKDYKLKILEQPLKDDPDQRKRLSVTIKNQEDVFSQEEKYFQFELEQVSDESGKIIKGLFYIKSSLDKSNIIVEDDDGNFLRSKSFEIISPEDEPLNEGDIFEFIVFSKTHKKLLEAFKRETDIERLNGFLEVLEQKFIIDLEGADLFIEFFTEFLKNKKSSNALWTEFTQDSGLISLVNKIFSAAELDPYLGVSYQVKGQVKPAKIEKLKDVFKKGFSDQLEDGQYIRVFWTAPDGIKKALKVVDLAVRKNDKDLNLVEYNKEDPELVRYFYSPGNPARILKAVEAEKFDPRTVFKVMFSDDGESFGLTFDEGENTFVLSANDVEGLRKEASLINAVSKDGFGFIRESKELGSFVPSTQKNHSKLFLHSGSFSRMSFLNLETNGYLSVGKVDNYLSTFSDIENTPAGIMISGKRIPSSYEEFSVQDLSEISKILIDLISLESVTESILGFMNFPSQYASIFAGKILKNSEKDKQLYLDCVEYFVKSIVKSEKRASQVLDRDDQLFSQLLEILVNLEFEEKDSLRVENLAAVWQRGFVGVENPDAPKDSNMFMVFYGDLEGAKSLEVEEESLNKAEVENIQKSSGWETQATKIQTPKQEDSSKENTAKPAEKKKVGLSLLVSMPNKTLGGVECLYAVSESNSEFEKEIRSEMAIALEDEITDLDFREGFYRYSDKVLIDADPFSQKARFVAVASGKAFGVKREDGMVLAARSLGFDEVEFDSRSWQDACLKFEIDGFFENFDKNSQHFEVEGKEISFHLNSLFLDSYASLEFSDDGFVRPYKRDKNTISLIKDKSQAGKGFKLIEYNELCNLLLSATKTNSNKEKVEFLQKASLVVFSEWDLKLLVDYILRLIALNRKSKSSWDLFIGADLFVSSIKDLVENLLENFQDDFKNLGFMLSEKQKNALRRELPLLSAEAYPNFEHEVEVEDRIIPFSGFFRELDSRLTNLADNSLDEYLNDLQVLFKRRVELDLEDLDEILEKNFSYSKNDIANWLEFEVAYNPIIQKAGVVKRVEDLAKDFKQDFKYEEIADNLDFMLSSLKGFSKDRVSLFLRQVEKAVDLKNLEKARNESFPLERLKVILRKAMANEMKRYLSKDLGFDKTYKPSIPEKLLLKEEERESLAEVVTVRDYLTRVVGSARYPVLKGSDFTSEISEKVIILGQSRSKPLDEKMDMANSLLSQVEGWKESIEGDYSEEDAIRLAGTSAQAPLQIYKSVEKNKFANVLRKLIGIISIDDDYKELVPKFRDIVDKLGDSGEAKATQSSSSSGKSKASSTGKTSSRSFPGMRFSF